MVLRQNRPFRAEMQLIRRRSADEGMTGAAGMLPAPAGDGADEGRSAGDVLLAAIHELRAEVRRDVESLLDRKLTEFRGELGIAAPMPAVSGQADETNELSREMHALHGEIAALSSRIEQTKTEVASLVNTKISSKRIDVVKDELDSVVSDTEGATAIILEAMERIDSAARHIKANSQKVVNQEWADEVLDQVVKVFEACNFQDLTGQRITKVVNTLKFIEERVAAIIHIIGEDVFADFDGTLDQSDHPDGLEKTLSQPSKTAERVSQEDIDKLFD